MNETRTINLNGLVYHIDYDAYQLLRDYLHDIELRLPQDDRQEIMADIEARIAELFQKSLFAKNVQVVNIQMVQSIKGQIGEPSEFGPNRRPKVKVDKSQNSGCGRVFSIVLNVVLAILALPVLFTGLAILFAIVLSLFGVAVAGTTSLASIMPIFPVLADLLVDGGVVIIPLLMVALILIIALPIVMLVHTIVTYMRTRRGPKARFWWITILFWLASIIFWGVSLVRLYQSYDMAGEVEAEDLVAQVMHINCAGASKAELNVVRELWAQAAGASHITYKGTPRIKQKMAVGGSIIRQD